MKIAIFGGSFNPVHIEHVNIVKAAIKSLTLDKVIIMPTGITPSKTGRMFADSADRLNMCKIAFSEVDKAVVSDYEISKEGISYSYLTCRKFQEKYPDDERFLIIGSDMLENFAKWKNPDVILKCVKLAVCARVDSVRLDNARQEFSNRFKTDYIQIDYVGKNISSTKIRVLAALGESLKGLVSGGVEKYICDNSLYTISAAQQVKKLMSPYRWWHTVGVAVMAAENCSRYNVDEKDAVCAALFHDSGKEIPLNDPLLSKFSIPQGVPSPVMHQFVSAYIAENIYGVKDKNILNAVKYHCSGRENMSPLEKLIYLSDMLEEGRNYDEVHELREIFFKDKDEAFPVALERQLNHLKSLNLPIYHLTQKAYDYAKEHKNDK